jgi:hypothetical protein
MHCTLVLLLQVVYSKLILMTQEELYPSELWSAREARSAARNLDTNSASVRGPRKTTENLLRISRSQDLPDAN